MSSTSTRYDVASAPSSRTELLTRYRAYRKRQARALLHMMPREAVRPLIRRAAREGFAMDATDPMITLVTYCESLLPLPPVDVWSDDVRRNPIAYVSDADDFGVVPTAEAPRTTMSREFSHDDRRWTAHLRSFSDGDAWRGFIAFEDSSSARVHRTTLIFREAGADDVCERFSSFESSTLVAFLRSALP